MVSEMYQRYARQIAIPEIGKEGQERINKGAVLVIGCGALGSMAAMELAGAGVGTIGIADFDTVDISNLQRQFFFKTQEAGESKANIMKVRIQELNPGINVRVYNEIITKKRAEEIFKDYDFILDATDNPDSKKMTGEVSKALKKPCCIGGVNNFEGQVMTFLPDDARFEEYFGGGVSEGFLPCSLGGVIGPAAALCATMQASEAIKYLIKTGHLLSGSLLKFNLKDNVFRKFNL